MIPAPRTPYRVVVSADSRLPPERRWVLTAPIVSTLEVDNTTLTTRDPQARALAELAEQEAMSEAIRSSGQSW
jgi:hypothetical protein